MLRVALELLHLARDFVDVSQQATRRFAVEASGWDERVVPLLALRPRTRVQFGPIIPALLRRKRRQMTPARTRVEGFVVCVMLFSQLRNLPQKSTESSKKVIQ